MRLPFRDRREAGRLLARKLKGFTTQSDVLVLALPRGGVPVGYEVAVSLEAPLDVFVVRKLGVPGHEELAFGAVATSDVRVLNTEVVQSVGLSKDQIDRITIRERQELARRERAYRGDRQAPDPAGRSVILVDDGLATGATMLAAARALRREGPKEVIIAVPVAAAVVCDELRPEVDDIVCVATPERFHAIGIWYDDFSQTSDEEVRQLLDRAARQHAL
jgi:predicted phosphoribosyltransferase